MFYRAGSIGFLATSNRVNVMLSRAKHGMYLLGNQATLTAKKLKRPTMLSKVRLSCHTLGEVGVGEIGARCFQTYA